MLALRARRAGPAARAAPILLAFASLVCLASASGLRARPARAASDATTAARPARAGDAEADRRAPAPPEAEERAARIARLEAAIARDEETLRRIVKLDPAAGDAAFHDHPVLRDIARRLPAMQEELRRLREQGAPAGAASPTP